MYGHQVMGMALSNRCDVITIVVKAVKSITVRLESKDLQP